MYHSRRKSRSCCLAKSRIDPRHRDHVKREVPRGVPRVLPLVRHRDDVGVEEVLPVVIARRGGAPAGGGGKVRVAGQPVLHHVVVKLLRPEQPGVGLAHDVALLGGRARARISFRKTRPPPRGALRRSRRNPRRASPASRRADARRKRSTTSPPAGISQRVMRRGFRPEAARIHRLRAAVRRPPRERRPSRTARDSACRRAARCSSRFP